MARLKPTAGTIGAALLLGLTLAVPGGAERFYTDDPLMEEPPPRPVEDARRRKLSDYYDFLRNMFGKAGERRDETGREVRARGVNTLGEPLAGAWWEPRHYYRRMTAEELKAGPGGSQPPADGKWTIIAAKSEGVTPGFMIRDERGRVYIVKFDPVHFPELATAADMISSRILHSAGYHVPEYYLVHFDADRLEIDDDVRFRDARGGVRRMRRKDVIELLLRAPRDRDGRWRAIASRLLEGKPLGPFRFDGTRSDDPNDTVPHEHLRTIRGYRVLCALVNHDDSRAINTLDMLVEGGGGRQYIKHHLIDFGATLGSATYGPDSPRAGREYLWEAGPAAKNLLSLGSWIPYWAKSKYPGIDSVGNFESKRFDPVRWVPEYPNPAFVNALPDDLFWGAKQVMALRDADLRAIVSAGGYSDPRATEYVVKTLAERRDKIGRAFFAGVLSLDKFRVEDGKLVFDDLEVQYGFVDSRTYAIQWSRFDNRTEQKTAISGATSARIPDVSAGYVAADVTAEDPAKAVTVYLRNQGGRREVVGIERSYPDTAPRGR